LTTTDNTELAVDKTKQNFFWNLLIFLHLPPEIAKFCVSYVANV